MRMPASNVNDIERAASVLAGTALLIGAMRGRTTTAKTIAGAGLVARGDDARHGAHIA